MSAACKEDLVTSWNDPAVENGLPVAKIDTSTQSKLCTRDHDESANPDDSETEVEERVTNTNSIPDGGLQAWLQVFAGHLMNFNTWGLINAYGLFQAYYTDHLHLPSSSVAWIPGIQIFLLCFVGAFSGRLTDAGYFRHSLATGCFFQLLGIFMTSIATEFWQLVLAHGFCHGLGNGLVFCPTLSLISTYFARNRSLAVGIVTGGSGTGGIIFTLIAQKLIPTLGFGWAVRIMGFVVLANVCMMLALFRTRLTPRKTGPLLELAAFKEKTYVLFIVSTFLILWPLYYAFDYINLYATNVVHVSGSTSLTMLLVMNGMGLPGRVFSGWLADRYLGPLNCLLVLGSMLAVLEYAWLGVSTYSGLFAFSVVYGLVNAGVQGIFMGSISSLTKDLSKMGTRVGMVLSIVSFATLTGPPIAGAILDASNGSYLGVQIYGGTTMFLGLTCLAITRSTQVGWKVKARL